MGLPDTIMDHFCGVRPISLAAVFRRRLRHGCYTMTTITTARVHRTVTSHGPRNAWNQFPCVPTYVNHCLRSFRVTHYIISNVILYAFLRIRLGKRQRTTFQFVERIQNNVWGDVMRDAQRVSSVTEIQVAFICNVAQPGRRCCYCTMPCNFCKAYYTITRSLCPQIDHINIFPGFFFARLCILTMYKFERLA